MCGEGEANPNYLDVMPYVPIIGPDRTLSTTIASDSAEQIFPRSDPLNADTLAEMVRISNPNTIITVLQPADGFQGAELQGAFSNGTVLTQYSFVGQYGQYAGVELTVIKIVAGSQ